MKEQQLLHITGNSIDLIRIAKKFPTHAEALIQRVLTNETEFRRLIQNNYQLCQMAQQFPTHAEALISYILKYPDLVKNSYLQRCWLKRH